MPELFLCFLTFAVPGLVDKAFCPGDPPEEAKSTNSKQGSHKNKSTPKYPLGYQDIPH